MGIIDTATGVLTLFNGLVITPLMDQQSYRDALGRAVRKGPVILAGDIQIALSTWFVDESLLRVSLKLVPPHLRNERTVEAQLLLKEFHDKLLQEQLGSPPYVFDWGQAESVYVDHDVSSEIWVRYNPAASQPSGLELT
ncbi:MAG: hypothetical protein ACLQVD_16450 [Capsulimonadaceae bacterium]